MGQLPTADDSMWVRRGLTAVVLVTAVVVALVGAGVAWNQTRSEAYDSLPTAHQHLVRNGVDLDVRCLPMGRVSEVAFVDAAQPKLGFRYTCELVPGVVRVRGQIDCADGRLRGPGFREDSGGMDCDEAMRSSPERLTSSLGGSLSSGGVMFAVLAAMVAGPAMIARGVRLRAVSRSGP